MIRPLLSIVMSSDQLGRLGREVRQPARTFARFAQNRTMIHRELLLWYVSILGLWNLN
jgi:hypothetical protein